MPFLVQGCINDHALAVTTATAKEAFAKAAKWHATEADVSIYDGVKIYSIEQFSLVMALQGIANTVEAAAELGPKAKLK